MDRQWERMRGADWQWSWKFLFRLHKNRIEYIRENECLIQQLGFHLEPMA